MDLPVALASATLIECGIWFLKMWISSPYACSIMFMMSLVKFVRLSTIVSNMVQNKYRKINYKVEKYEVLKKDQWIIVPDMHEPIVTREVFDMVQNLVGRNNTKYTKNPMPKGENGESIVYQHILAGLIFCGECGSKNRDTLERNMETLQQRKIQLLKYQEDSREILAAIDDFMANEILSKATIHKLISRIETFSDKSVKLYANFSCA